MASHWLSSARSRAVEVEPLRRVEGLLWAGALLQRRQRRRRRSREVGRGPLVGLAHVEQERVAFCDVRLDGLEVRRQRPRGEASAGGSCCTLEKRIARARHDGCDEHAYHHVLSEWSGC